MDGLSENRRQKCLQSSRKIKENNEKIMYMICTKELMCLQCN